MKRTNKLIALILAWATTVSTPANATPLSDGNYRETVDGVEWMFTITNGTAKIVNWEQSESSAISTNAAGTISVPSTLGGCDVSSIGDFAFAKCGKLVSFIIPNGILSIGDYAFSECSALSTITFPDTMTSIGRYAFQNCQGLESVTVPPSLVSFGYEAFSRCSGLTGVYIRDLAAWCTISFGSFYYANPLYQAKHLYLNGAEVTDLVIPDGVTEIEYVAFVGGRNFRSVTIPASMKSIGYGAFSACNGLQAVHIEDLEVWCNIAFGATSDSNPLYHAHHLFLNGDEVTSLAVPESVTQIRNYSFSGCSGLTSVSIPNNVTSIGSSAFSGCSGLTSISIADSVTMIGDGAFAYCSGLSAITIPERTTIIGGGAFYGCYKLFDTETIPGLRLVDGWAVGTNGVPVLSGGLDLKGCRGIAGSALAGCSELTEIIIPDSVAGIGKSAFQNCSGLTIVNADPKWASCFSSIVTNLSFVIPYGVTNIAPKAFSYCRGLVSVVIPNSVTVIGNSAFDSCSDLVSVSIPESVTNIPSYAFFGCSKLTSIAIPNSTISIEKGAFEGCFNLFDTESIPGVRLVDGWAIRTNGVPILSGSLDLTGCRGIAEHSFIGCTKLTSITIPDSVASIGNSAFYGCSGLMSITIPNGVTNIGDYAFGACSGLTSITIPNGVTSIGDYAFGGCSGLTSITIPDCVANIGNSAFLNCRGLTSITIPNSVTNIGNYAFDGCSGLTSITIPNSVTNIGNSAFSSCFKLDTLILPARFKGKTDKMSIRSGCHVIFSGIFDLTVASDYGDPTPGVGITALEVIDQNEVSCSLSGTNILLSPGVRSVYSGWTGTGSVPASGTGTNVTFSIEEDSSITWNWRKENQIALSVRGAGTSDFGTQWVADGSTATVSIVPSTPLFAASLAGDADGATVDGATLSIPSDRPREIEATVEALLVATGISHSYSDDGTAVDIAFGVSDIADGATFTATLEYGGRTFETKTFSSSGFLVWSGIPALPRAETATVAVTVARDGVSRSHSWTRVITPLVISDVTEHASAATALRMRMGDIALLPEPVGSASYEVLNPRFATLNGTILTALEPGIVGIRCVDAASNTNTLAVLVLPDTIGDGNVYVFKEGEATANYANWETPELWEKIGSQTNDSWPHEPDDIAILPFYDKATFYARLSSDISLGELIVGGYKDVASTFYIDSIAPSFPTITFSRSDGEKARLQSAPNTTENRRAAPFFRKVRIEYASDTVIDGGWSGVANDRNRGLNGLFDTTVTNSIPEGVSVEFRNLDGTEHFVDYQSTVYLSVLEGGGTLWNRSSGQIRYRSSSPGFSGVLRDSSRNLRTSGYGARQGPTYLRAEFPNAISETVGFVQSVSGRPVAGNGTIVTGWGHSWGESWYGLTNWFTARGLRMHGGTWEANMRQVSQPENGIDADRKHGALLQIEDGFSYLKKNANSNAELSSNWIEFDQLEHVDKGTFLIVDPSRATVASTATATNSVTILRGWEKHAIGAEGNCEETSKHPVVPWIVSTTSSQGVNHTYSFAFASFDATNRLVRPVLRESAVANAEGDDNVLSVSKTLTLTDDASVNSLVLYNTSASQRKLGAERTLTISSGGLFLGGNGTSVGIPGGDENGALALGDENHPAYVWAASTSAAAPNQIWAEVTAPGGFVSAYTGWLVLGGDQTGIADELVVNAGSLQLGTADFGCRLAPGLPIRVCAGSTLVLAEADAAGGNAIRFDGADGRFGRVELPEGVAATCDRIYLRDFPEATEWTNLPAGTYGSSESGADIVRDDLFSGKGVLVVAGEDFHRIAVFVSGSGSCDFGERLVEDGAVATAEIVPATHLYSISLSGDTDGVSLSGTTLSIPSDRARTIIATIEETKLGLVVSTDHGTATPTGRTEWSWGDEVTASVEADEPVDGVRFVCAGWTGTGSVPASGTGAEVSFEMEVDSTLDWTWEEQVRVEFVMEAGDPASDVRWVARGGENAVFAFPKPDGVFACSLAGDTDGVVVDKFAGTVSVPADRPRSVRMTHRAVSIDEAVSVGSGSPVWGRTGGASDWRVVDDATASDGFCLRSGEIGIGETSAFEATVEGPGTVSFDWRISSHRGHYARFYLDGVETNSITRATDWTRLSFPLGSGFHTLRWTYEKGTGVTGGEDAAFLDNVCWAPLTLAEALDATNLVWTTEGGAAWMPQIDVSSDGEDAARSGAVVGEETSRLATTVRGTGTFAWKWKADVAGSAGVDVLLDGESLYDAGVYLEGSMDWTDASIQIEGAGEHTVVFEYWNGGTDATISDCAYLDQVSWTPDKPDFVIVEGVKIPTAWLDENAASFVAAADGGYEAAVHAAAANGRPVWQCYVAGLDPNDATSKLVAAIDMDGGAPVVRWSPDLNEGGTKAERVYTVEGKEALSDPDWGPTNAASRFFRVKVEMP